MSSSRSVFISYSWSAEKKHPLVDELLAALHAKDIEVKRDSNAINYGNSIRAYMDELAAGGAIILVLSEEYFKSPNCMYELREIYLNGRKEFRKRIFPVVLKGTKFHKLIERIPYIRHWEEETEKLKAALDTVARENVGSVSHNELRDYAAFRQIIDELLALIGDMNHLTEEEHLKTGFAALIKRMFSHSAPDGGGGTDKTGKTVDIRQNVSGNGNVSSGSGDIYINNLNINAAKKAQQPDEKSSQTSPAKPGTLFGVPDPPPNYFARPDDLKKFRAALLAEGTQAVGITGKRQHVGVQGMGGLGKSVLAAALAHDEEVRAEFPDGIFWLRFRQDADDAYLIEQQAEILKILAPDHLPDTLAYGENLLNLALEDKRCLFIADDLWDSKHLRHFNIKSSGCRFLLTTRNAEVIKKTGAHRCELGLLDEKQAREFLALSSGYAENDLPDEAAAILRECGRLPLAVAAIGSMVRDEPAEYWRLVLQRLQNARIDKIPADFDDNYDYENLLKVFQVSVEALPLEVQELYKTLAVFPEDARIPLSVFQLYWEYCGSWEHEPLDVVSLLVKRSLLTRLDDNLYSLHDLLRDYLRHQSGGDVASLHKQLLEAYKTKYPGGWHKIPVPDYSYFHNYWYIHAKIVGGNALTSEIADDLIFCQNHVSYNTFKKALEFVDYQLSDIAPHLLRDNHHIYVLRDCLDALGRDGRKEAHRLLKERQAPNVEHACLEFLGEEGKQYARQLIKESDDWLVLYSCLKLLKEEAKEDARRILTENKHPELDVHCLSILGDEAKEDIRRLLRSTKNEHDFVSLFWFIGKDDREEAKEIAQRLLETTKEEFIKNMCQYYLNTWRYAELEDERQQ